MRVVLDLEANSLTKPTQIWCIVCKDIDTDRLYIFKDITSDDTILKQFKEFHKCVRTWIGHNLLGYDVPCLSRLTGINFDISSCVDTLIVSKLVDYSRPNGHSVETYGVEFGLEKIKFNDFTKWSKELEEYCIRDVAICSNIYNKYRRHIDDPVRHPSIVLEHRFQLVVNSLHDNGFHFDIPKANKLLARVTEELRRLDEEILKEFPPRLKLVRVVEPVLTKHGTLNKKDFRWVEDGDLSDYNGGHFCKCSWVAFNPASHKQITEVLNEAGWKPTDKTQTHIDTEREINKLKYSKGKQSTVDLENKLAILLKYGWKINENNLSTLPAKAPSPARTLAQRILIESRRRTLTEWLGLVTENTDQRIHGKFYGIGAWTHRMAHQKPNTANIPTEVKLYGKEMRSLWQAPKGRLLVGVDAEGIQLRVFAHYINDKEFTNALVKGSKTDKSDPHSLNQRILGGICKTRQEAKRFIFAFLLGGGIGKLAQILDASERDTKEALNRLLRRYDGLAYMRKEVFPKDASRSYFIGLDGRHTPIPGETQRDREHLAMSGYLQNGEAIIMKLATLKWDLAKYDSLLVNFVHDEYVIETPSDLYIAEEVARIVSQSLTDVGEELKLKCPMKGDWRIGKNWYEIH